MKSFATFSEVRKQHYVSTDIAVEWAGLAASVPQRAHRLGTVIRFARYLHAEDECHEVPPAVFGAENWPRPTPYILTGEQIQQLVAAASQLKYRICAATYPALFSLLACTGLRVSEATQLQLDDITRVICRRPSGELHEGFGTAAWTRSTTGLRVRYTPVGYSCTAVYRRRE
ncbi:MAG: hypothetical protein ACRD7E_02110 [Bryobacteraceae bacterium]